MNIIEQVKVLCCEQVIQAVSGDVTQCSRWSVVTREGKPYCRQHDPWKTPQFNIGKHEVIVFEDGTAERTLSRDTAIKLVEAATGYLSVMNLMPVPMDSHQEMMKRAIQLAKRELGI